MNRAVRGHTWGNGDLSGLLHTLVSVGGQRGGGAAIWENNDQLLQFLIYILCHCVALVQIFVQIFYV